MMSIGFEEKNDPKFELINIEKGCDKTVTKNGEPLKTLDFIGAGEGNRTLVFGATSLSA